MNIDDIFDKQRYINAGKSAQPRVTASKFDDFIHHLGLTNAFNAYKAEKKEFFTEHAQRMPAFESKKMWPYNPGQSAAPANVPPDTMPNTRSKSKKAPQKGAMAAQPSEPPHASASTSVGYGKSRTVNETELFREFTNTWESLAEEYSVKFTDLDPFSRYSFASHETSAVSGSTIKPDGVLFLASTTNNMVADIHILFEAKISEYPSELPDDVLGQIAEYSHEVWSAQPTRKFVPAFLLHGGKLSLFVFLRFDVLRIELGRVFYRNSSKRFGQTRLIAECLMRLMFLTQQSPKNFGHYVDIMDHPSALKFSGSKSESEVEVSSLDVPGSVSIGKRIDRKVPLFHRSAYLYRAKWNGKEAVLKLSWTPHDRQPEGAIYDILKHEGVSGIPEIYDSGILIKNFFDYRLEYILMEDCGATINNWTDRDYQRFVGANRNIAMTADFIGMAVSSAISCLLQAKLAGVLHRDISPGNIAVNSEGEMFVIDWGYARPICDDLDPVVKRQVERDWQINVHEIDFKERQHDPMTGTLCFMGIRILSGHGDRSILDDLESIFYVALYMFAQEYSGKEEYKLMRLKNNTNGQAALIKVGGLACCRKYPIFFGVNPEKAESVCKALGPLYNMLFIRNDAFIGAILAEENDDIRCEPLDPFWSTMKKLYPIDTAEESCAATDTSGNDTGKHTVASIRCFQGLHDLDVVC
ncbi:hypothetical protein GGI07_004998 [Coemansia sp. Benny D115]|nr:hypothetical protein GGI07_004998 [Coemansia sp. Benny D115]